VETTRGLSLSIKLTIAYSVLILIVAAALTVSLYWQLRVAQRQAMSERLRDIASFAIPLIDGDIHAAIKTPQDEAGASYHVIFLRLKYIQSTSYFISKVYTLRQRPDGGIIYVVDANKDLATRAGFGAVYQRPGLLLQRGLTYITQPIVEDDLYIDDTGDAFLSGYAPIYDQFHNLDGVLGIDIYANTIIAHEQRTQEIAWQVFLATVPAALLVGWGVARRMTAPVIDLVAGAQRVERGQLDQDVPVRSRDELGVLAWAFNSMQDGLRQSRLQLEEYAGTLEQQVAERTQRLERLYAETQRHVTELDTLADIGRALLSTLDIHSLFQVIAEQTARVMHAENLYIALYHPETAEIEFAFDARIDMPRTGRRRKWTNGVTEYVIQTRQPVFLRGDVPRQLSQLGIDVIGTVAVAWIGVPMLIGDRVLGVLSVQHYTDPMAYDDSHVALLQSIANQAAIALENARLYTEAQRARETAEAANKAKSTFLATMSHELRTPLNAILGFSQIMARDASLNAEQRDNLGIISRSGEHLLELINDVLELSKIEAARLVLQKESLDLYRLLANMEDLFRLRTQSKGLALEFDIAPDVPQYVRTDENKLSRVVINLLSNAVKFTHEGGIALRVRADKTEVSLSTINLSTLYFQVEDTGVGIAPDELDKVFDPFVQAASGRRSAEGTGLGLLISRQYVRLMGGDIRVRSELDRGTLFEFDVQVELADAADVLRLQASLAPRKVLGVAPGQPVYRLLIVEDQDASRKLLVKLLAPLGFELREAANGQEALEMCLAWQPHLVLMDIRMPVLDGLEATRRIKAAPQGQGTIVIALTASAFEEDRDKILAQGCDDFVRKPFRESEILDKLTHHLGVQFVYETGTAVKSGREALTPEALAMLPAEWRIALKRAAVDADLEKIECLINQVRGQNAALAETLAHLAHNYDHDTILAWLA
jgi:signal transduction histidine kinase/DNA-binding response OmpR family regulator/HAMP domain-containing protein